jgi:hypothetical protein
MLFSHPAYCKQNVHVQCTLCVTIAADIALQNRPRLAKTCLFAPQRRDHKLEEVQHFFCCPNSLHSHISSIYLSLPDLTLSLSSLNVLGTAWLGKGGGGGRDWVEPKKTTEKKRGPLPIYLLAVSNFLSGSSKLECLAEKNMFTWIFFFFRRKSQQFLEETGEKNFFVQS